MYNSNPYNMYGMMPQMQQPTPQQLTRVTGLEGAKAYQMAPNSTVALFDGSSDIMYIKCTDGAGFPTIRTFSFTPMECAPASPEYVTRKEFEELKEAIRNAKQSVSTEPAQQHAGNAPAV